MKSIYLLCEYGIPYSTVKKLNENNILITDLKYNPDCLNEMWGKGNKKKSDILKFLPLVLESEYEDSVYSLIDFGLSNALADVLYNKNIRIENFSLLDMETAKEKYDIKNSTYEKTKESIEKYFEFKNENRGKGYPNYVLQHIKSKYIDKSFTEEDLKSDLKNSNYDIYYLEKDLEFLVQSKQIEYENNIYSICLPKLIDVVQTLKQEHKEILMKKFEGRTLESIGQEKGVTRERIRQIISNSLSKIPVLYEDKYSEIFTEYNFDCDTFCEIFETKKYVYYYLKEKYNLGQTDISELLELDILNENQKQILKEKCNMITYNNENIVVNKINVLEAMLKEKEEQIELDNIMSLYNEKIKEYNLEYLLEYLTSQDIRNVEALLNRSNKVIMSLGRKYRYYDLSSIKNNETQKLRELLNTEPGEYSTELFFNNNPLLMKELNIKDEYELHYILKKLFYLDENFNFTRMPNILINCQDKLKFVEEKIIELSPINVDDFCEFMYQNYGHKTHTYKSFILTNFDKYLNGNTFVTQTPQFSEKQKEIIKEHLTKDVYSIQAIKKLLTDLFDVNDFSLINNNNLSQIGYKVRGNYIMKNFITSFEEYLRNKVNSVEYFEIDSEYKKMGSTFSTYVYKMIYNMELFKLNENKYITLRGLNSLGIQKQDIINLETEILTIINENEYFNLTFIKKKNLFNKFNNLELTDEFFETIISIIEDINTFRIDGNKMFIKGKGNFTREKFISSIIEEKKKIKTKDLKQYLIDKYEIDIELYELRQYINRKRFYYHEGTDCIYLNKEMYDNEVEKWDILKYIN